MSYQPDGGVQQAGWLENPLLGPGIGNRVLRIDKSEAVLHKQIVVGVIE
ncbi:hypothetical protein HCH_00742 [Hahella chejuensis KCTC 2396]|uniref:Uncharacterized protein n=1 Tax=Hahella chejuensis (strain KCTC 2396) TaxID=349521 RepID=Q2SNY5_HAHCH|nr:hypothetical protein HCH_00742 [Hahella chejuensis KCTC 2396]